MKSLLTIVFSAVWCLPSIAQQKPIAPVHTPAPATTPVPKSNPKLYKDVITDKAVSQRGLLTVHRVDDKYFFEIADSVFNREILAITRFSKTPAGSNSYGGEKVNEQTIRFEKGPASTVFLRVLTIVSVAGDSTEPIAQAVSNSNLDPIAAAFDIKAYGKDSATVVIDVTDFFKNDNQPVSLNQNIKRRYNLGGIASERSYIESIHSYPINLEVKTVKTFSATPSTGNFLFGPATSIALPAAEASGAVTVELNNSFILLPKIPMRKRLYDPRVGFFASNYTEYTDAQQKINTVTFIHHWRLEPKDEDSTRWKEGQLVEPKKPIVFYIDPATPKKWRPYLIAGINDWQAAFEKAGFRNAIIGKEWPANDSGMSLEDARFSVIRYFASDIENAYGPNEADPRSGEILESHIGWYHNVMKLVHDWYLIQAGAVDPRARTMVFSDSLMGTLIRFVSSHEVGHTLGLRHNMGSSSQTPVEKLRDKAWVEAHGHTNSIMDYARFNYVAQPEDHISPAGLYPRIGDYDKWAITWGYKPIAGTANEEADKKVLNQWTIAALTADPALWFGGSGNDFDPRAQTEDLGDNSMRASAYGIKNLKRVLAGLPEWTKQEADTYDNLQDMYGELTLQFSRYMAHVTKNVGGIYENIKSIEQKGDVYQLTPKPVQQEAVAFLQTQLFETPYWLLDQQILNKISNPSTPENISGTQTNILNSLLSSTRLYRMSLAGARFGAGTYSVDELMTDIEKGLWSELRTKKTIDPFRRNLQKTYVDALSSLINNQPGNTVTIPRAITIFFGGDIKNTDVPSVARAHLNQLRNQINAAIPATTDKISRYHLQDVTERIRIAVSPRLP